MSKIFYKRLFVIENVNEKKNSFIIEIFAFEKKKKKYMFCYR